MIGLFDMSIINNFPCFLSARHDDTLALQKLSKVIIIDRFLEHSDRLYNIYSELARLGSIHSRRELLSSANTSRD